MVYQIKCVRCGEEIPGATVKVRDGRPYPNAASLGNPHCEKCAPVALEAFGRALAALRRPPL